MIQLPLINPLRISGSNFSYNFDHNSDFCYFQKWQLGDVINLQFLSNSEITLRVQSLEDGLIKKEFLSVEIPNNLQDVNFSTHEFSIHLDESLDYGKYIFLISSSEIESVFILNPIEYKESFNNTVLFKYRNSFNDFDCIFETGIEFFFRIEGTVNMFSPKIDSVIYINQKKNHELLSATPWRAFTLFVGNGRGAPDWALDLVNRILSVDIKKVDNLLFEITEGAEMEIIRSDNYPLAAASIEISEKINHYSQILQDSFLLSDNEDFYIKTNNTFNLTK